ELRMFDKTVHSSDTLCFGIWFLFFQFAFLLQINTFYIFCIHNIHGICSVVKKSVIRSGHLKACKNRTIKLYNEIENQRSVTFSVSSAFESTRFGKSTALEMVGSDVLLKQPQDEEKQTEMKTKLTHILRQLAIFFLSVNKLGEGGGSVIAFTLTIYRSNHAMGSIQKPGLLPAIAFWQKGSEKEMGNLKAEVSQHRSRAVGGGERFLEEEFSLQ
ncbi:hypothetical protein MG293_020290, partial [Ovis ammon polii]